MLPWYTIGETKQLEAGDSEKDRTRYVSHGNRKLKLEEEYFYVYAAGSFGSFDKVISTHIKVSPSVHSSNQAARNLRDSFRKYYRK